MREPRYKGRSRCFGYGYVYTGMHHIKRGLRTAQSVWSLLKHHFMQIPVMNCAHAREQHVFVYNI